MEAKLRSITRQIRWSLVAKAAFSAVIWYALPLWVFFVFALFCYLFPLFRGLKFLPLFVVFLILAGLAPPNPGVAVLIGIAFFLILGDKNLLLIDRAAAYEMLVFIFFFLGFYEFFRFAVGIPGILPALLSVFLGALYFYALLGCGEYYGKGSASRTELLVAGAGGLLLFELAYFLTRLPIASLIATAIAFLAAASMFEFMSEGLFGRMARRDALAVFSVFFALFAVLLASINWRF